MTSPLEIGPAAGAQEAIVADLGEAAREDVLEEARDEDVDREGQAAGWVSARVRVGEGDAAMREAFETLVGEGDAIDIAREIEGGVLAAPDGLDVDGPGTLPDGRSDRVG